MTSMFDELNTKYGEETDLRIFFTTEPFSNRKGYHNPPLPRESLRFLFRIFMILFIFEIKR